ncbi:MAG TPA: hypothetical protein PKE31_15715 [Pseudomonadota bacterium]|nr:hypothetical protein [Pseudomonadota bacterium]
MTWVEQEVLPFRLWELAFRISGEVLCSLGWPPFRRFVEARTSRDLTAELHALTDDVGTAHLEFLQSTDAHERDDATFLSDTLYPLRALVLLLYDRNSADRERHFARLRELLTTCQLLRELDYPRGVGRWLLVRSLGCLALAACGRADDRLISELRSDDEEARERVLDRLGERVLTLPGRWHELSSFLHGEPNRLLQKLSVPKPLLVQMELRSDVLKEVLGPFSHLSSLYVSPEIPDKKLRTARKFCEVPDEEHVLALIDCTVFGSASDAVLFGNRHLFFRNFVARDGRPGRISYADLCQVPIHRAGDGELVFGEKITANLSGSGLSAADLLVLLKELQKRLLSTTPHSHRTE